MAILKSSLGFIEGIWGVDSEHPRHRIFSTIDKKTGHGVDPVRALVHVTMISGGKEGTSEGGVDILVDETAFGSITRLGNSQMLDASNVSSIDIAVRGDDRADGKFTIAVIDEGLRSQNRRDSVRKSKSSKAGGGRRGTARRSTPKRGQR